MHRGCRPPAGLSRSAGRWSPVRHLPPGAPALVASSDAAVRDAAPRRTWSSRDHDDRTRPRGRWGAQRDVVRGAARSSGGALDGFLPRRGLLLVQKGHRATRPSGSVVGSRRPGTHRHGIGPLLRGDVRTSVLKGPDARTCRPGTDRVPGAVGCTDATGALVARIVPVAIDPGTPTTRVHPAPDARRWRAIRVCFRRTGQPVLHQVCASGSRAADGQRPGRERTGEGSAAPLGGRVRVFGRGLDRRASGHPRSPCRAEQGSDRQVSRETVSECLTLGLWSGRMGG
jgi:hypothetical protein